MLSKSLLNKLIGYVFKDVSASSLTQDVSNDESFNNFLQQESELTINFLHYKLIEKLTQLSFKENFWTKENSKALVYALLLFSKVCEKQNLPIEAAFKESFSQCIKPLDLYTQIENELNFNE